MLFFLASIDRNITLILSSTLLHVVGAEFLFKYKLKFFFYLPDRPINLVIKLMLVDCL